MFLPINIDVRLKCFFYSCDVNMINFIVLINYKDTENIKVKLNFNPKEFGYYSLSILQ